MSCGTKVSEALLPVFRTDFGVTKWCHYLPFVEKENVFYLNWDANILSMPEFIFFVRLQSFPIAALAIKI